MVHRRLKDVSAAAGERDDNSPTSGVGVLLSWFSPLEAQLV